MASRALAGTSRPRTAAKYSNLGTLQPSRTSSHTHTKLRCLTASRAAPLVCIQTPKAADTKAWLRDAETGPNCQLRLDSQPAIETDLVAWPGWPHFGLTRTLNAAIGRAPASNIPAGRWGSGPSANAPVDHYGSDGSDRAGVPIARPIAESGLRARNLRSVLDSAPLRRGRLDIAPPPADPDEREKHSAYRSDALSASQQSDGPVMVEDDNSCRRSWDEDEDVR